MSLRPVIVQQVPEDTARVARAAFPKGHAYLRLYDELGPLYADRQFAALFPARGELPVGVDRPQLVVEPQVRVALGEGSTGHAGGVFGHLLHNHRP